MVHQKVGSPSYLPLLPNVARAAGPHDALAAAGAAPPGRAHGDLSVSSVTRSIRNAVRDERLVPHEDEYPQENPPDKTGNEPAPLLLIAVAVISLLGVAGWFIFG